MKSDKVVITVTKNGSLLGKKVAAFLKADLKVPARFALQTGIEYGYDRPVGLEIQAAFNRYEVLVLIMATSVAVRSIAPVIGNNQTDPAVIVMDEAGRFAISLLPGHWGGGDRIAEDLAKFTKGVAVNTTAFDVNNLQSLDLVARKYGLTLENLELPVKFSGAVINGDPVVIWDRWGINETWPENVRVVTGESLELADNEKLVVVIGYREPLGIKSDTKVFALRPSNLVVGVGCAQGVPGTRIIGAIRRYFRERNWSTRSIQSLATIDLQAEEPGLTAAVRELGVSLQIFKKEELDSVGDGLENSDLTQKNLGIGGVCEPAAILGSKHGKLIGAKQNLNQITVAVAAITERFQS
ncbi:MAG: cobalt-precorrin 5A hydrolase [Bacteroidota bacterium]